MLSKEYSTNIISEKDNKKPKNNKNNKNIQLYLKHNFIHVRVAVHNATMLLNNNKRKNNQTTWQLTGNPLTWNKEVHQQQQQQICLLRPLFG